MFANSLGSASAHYTSFVSCRFRSDSKDWKYELSLQRVCRVVVNSVSTTWKRTTRRLCDFTPNTGFVLKGLKFFHRSSRSRLFEESVIFSGTNGLLS